MFNTTRPTPVSGGQNEGINFGKVAVKPRTEDDSDHGGGGGTGRTTKCWRFGGDHMRREFPKRA